MKKTMFLEIGLAAAMAAVALWHQPACAGDNSSAQRGNAQDGKTALTADQQKQVKEILSHYNAASLTAENARAIHEAFRNAGLRCGPGMADTIKEAGFDPDRLKELAPPPERGNGKGKDRPAQGRDGDRAKEETDRPASQDTESAR
jgi:hypothetical protein